MSQEPEHSAPADGASTEAQTQESVLTPEQQLIEAQQKLAEISDAYLRAKADMENTRRRAAEDVSKAHKFAVESFADSLLPVKDSLEAALATFDAGHEGGAAPAADSPLGKLREGVDATLRQLSSALERNKVIAIQPAAGAKFDPHHHQAISVVPAQQEPHTVVTVLQKGYLIADRVLRPALVTVSAP